MLIILLFISIVKLTRRNKESQLFYTCLSHKENVNNPSLVMIYSQYKEQSRYFFFKLLSASTAIMQKIFFQVWDSCDFFFNPICWGFSHRMGGKGWVAVWNFIISCWSIVGNSEILPQCICLSTISCWDSKLISWFFINEKWFTLYWNTLTESLNNVHCVANNFIFTFSSRKSKG